MVFPHRHFSAILPVLILLLVSFCIALKDSVLQNHDLHNFLSSHPALPRLNFEDEYSVFLAELENGTAKANGKSRQKRYVYLNLETNLDVGLFMVIPITIVLPSMSNLFNNWRRKRSLDNFDTNITSTEELSPMFQSQVDRLSAYFDLMNVPEKACQLRAVCELAAEPANYFPLSDVILSKIRNPSVGQYKMDPTSSVKPSMFQLFSHAADEGAMFGAEKCETSYSRNCKYHIDKLLNMPVMKFWRKLQEKMRLKFDEESGFTF